MYFLFIILLTLSALFDSRYQKIRSDILIVLLSISIILWIENRNKAKLITDILFITLLFSIFFISNYYLYKNKPFYHKKSSTILHSGDKILFLSLMFFSGVEKGIIIILFGLFVALIWANVIKIFFIHCQRRTLPFYPFMALSLIIMDIINGI